MWAAAVLGAGGFLAACGGDPPAPPSANQGIVENRALPPSVESIPLTTEQGTQTSLAAYKGKIVVVAPFLSLCQDECPLVTAAFIALQRDVEAAGLGHRFVFLEVTVDPGRDTPDRLSQYAKRFGATWPLLTGAASDLHTFWSYFGVSYAITPEEQPPMLDWLTGQPLTYDVGHTDGYLLVDQRGHLRFTDANPPNLHGKLDAKLKGLLDGGGVQNLDHPTGITWSVSDALSALGWLAGQTIPSAGGS
jgi:protein SCO1/2